MHTPENCTNIEQPTGVLTTIRWFCLVFSHLLVFPCLIFGSYFPHGTQYALGTRKPFLYFLFSFRVLSFLFSSSLEMLYSLHKCIFHLKRIRNILCVLRYNAHKGRQSRSIRCVWAHRINEIERKWSLQSLIRMDFVNGSRFLRYQAMHKVYHLFCARLQVIPS